MISSAYAAGVEHAHEAAAPFYLDPHFWVYVAFVAVVGLSWRRVGRAIAAALDARAAKIQARLDEARKLRDDAQDLLAAYQRKQRDADAARPRTSSPTPAPRPNGWPNRRPATWK